MSGCCGSCGGEEQKSPVDKAEDKKEEAKKTAGSEKSEK